MPPDNGKEIERLPEVVQYRLQRVEQSVEAMSARLEAVANTLGGQMTALQTQLIAFQQKLPDSYAPRREADERHRGINDRFVEHERIHDANMRRIERIESLAWGFVGALLISLITAIIGLLRTIPAPHP